MWATKGRMWYPAWWLSGAKQASEREDMWRLSTSNTPTAGHQVLTWKRIWNAHLHVYHIRSHQTCFLKMSWLCPLLYTSLITTLIQVAISCLLDDYNNPTGLPESIFLLLLLSSNPFSPQKPEWPFTNINLTMAFLCLPIDLKIKSQTLYISNMVLSDHAWPISLILSITTLHPVYYALITLEVLLFVTAPITPSPSWLKVFQKAMLSVRGAPTNFFSHSCLLTGI